MNSFLGLFYVFASQDKATYFTFEKFRRMCILSGCDYLESLRGIGIKKAFKIYARPNVNADLWTQLRHVINHIKITLPEVRTYMDKFTEAENTFLYQLVYDPESRRLCPLTEYPEGKAHVDFPYAGDWLAPEKALQTACGNYDLKTDEVIANTNTTTWWCDVEANLTPKKPVPKATVPNILVSRRSLPALNPKQKTIKHFFTRRTKSTAQVVEKNEEDELISYYFKKQVEDEDIEIKSAVKKFPTVVEEKKDGVFEEVRESVDFAAESVASVTKPKAGLAAFSALEKFTSNARLRKTEIDPSAPKVSLVLKGLLSTPRNDVYGAKCHAESKFENETVKFKFSDF